MASAAMRGAPRLRTPDASPPLDLVVLFVIGAAIVYAEKAAEERSAFIRWRHQVLEFMQGVNIYDTVMYPNPPIMPLTLYPLMVLPPVVGALCWFALKVVLTAASA